MGGKCECVGVFKTTLQCTLGKDGGRCQIKRCPKCKEKRCRTHCRCGRAGKAVGRRAPRRGADPKTRAQPKARARAKPASLPLLQAQTSRPIPEAAAEAVFAHLPVARGLVHTLGDAAWFRPMLYETQKAVSWMCATLNFDDTDTATLLLRKLKAPGSFECVIVVDEQSHLAGGARGQRALLRQLQTAGATIYLARGNEQAARRLFGEGHHHPSMHKKAVVIDDRVAYSGGANVTRKSRCNGELMFRFEGPTVADIASEVRSVIGAAVAARV